MSARYASMALAAAALLAGATQVWSQAGADAPEPPTQRGGPAPMPKPVTLADRPNASGGEALYVEFCAMCHAPNGMGHGLLGRRVDTPDLEKRGNLPAQYVVLAARQGIGNMPAIPRGEVSDAELQAIADYLAAGPHGETP